MKGMIAAARRNRRNLAIGAFPLILVRSLLSLRRTGRGHSFRRRPGALTQRWRVVIGPELPEHFPLVWILANNILHRVKHPLRQPNRVGALVSCALWEDRR